MVGKFIFDIILVAFQYTWNKIILSVRVKWLNTNKYKNIYYTYFPSKSYGISWSNISWNLSFTLSVFINE